MHSCGRPRERAFLGDCDEVFQLPEFDVVMLSIHFNYQYFSLDFITEWSHARGEIGEGKWDHAKSSVATLRR